MNPTPARLEKQVVRKLVFEVLTRQGDSQFAAVPLLVAQQAVAGGYLDLGGRHYADEGILHPGDKLVISDVIWELLIQGILAPGTANGGDEFPFFRLTEYGRECINQEAILPHDYENYLQNVRQIMSMPDPVFTLYLEESVQAFLKGLYISTTVNLGVAAERLVQLLIEKYAAQLEGDNEKKFNEAIAKAKHPAVQFEEVYRRLEVDKKKMPNGLGNDLSMLKFIQEVIRTERNDAGHPSGRRFTRDEAMTYLLTFPSYLKIYQQVVEWIQGEDLEKESK